MYLTKYLVSLISLILPNPINPSPRSINIDIPLWSNDVKIWSCRQTWNFYHHEYYIALQNICLLWRFTIIFLIPSNLESRLEAEWPVRRPLLESLVQMIVTLFRITAMELEKWSGYGHFKGRAETAFWSDVDMSWVLGFVWPMWTEIKMWLVLVIFYKNCNILSVRVGNTEKEVWNLSGSQKICLKRWIIDCYRKLSKTYI